MRIVVICAGILLAGTGIWYFANPGAPFIAFAFPLGISMLVCGLCNMLAFIVFRKTAPHAPALFAEGLITLVLSVVVLSNMILTDGMIVIFFGLWSQFTGVLRITTFTELRKNKVRGCNWELGGGILSLVLGVYCLFNPLLAGLSLVAVTGGIFILSGANTVIGGVLLRSYRADESAATDCKKIKEGNIDASTGI